ncbi:MAG TPA: PAS domain S-box protein [Pirellulales bacterium]
MSKSQSLTPLLGALRTDQPERDGIPSPWSQGSPERASAYEAAFEHAAIGMALVGLNGKLLSANRALCQILGYQRDELVSLRFDANLHPQDIPFDFGLISELLAGKREHFHIEKRYVHKQGHALWILLSVSLVYDDAQQPCYFIAQLQDITDRRRAEATFHALLESAPDAMIIANRQGRIVLVNAQAQAYFGYHADEMLGQPVEMLLPERFRGEHPAHRDRYFASPRVRGMGVGTKLYARRKDGGEVPVEISLSLIEVDEVPHVCCAIRDLTQWNHADETHRRLTAVEHLASHRNELAQMLRLNTMSEMAAGIAHELNQPLSAIANYARGAARRMNRGVAKTDELMPVIDSIAEEAVRASEIIRSVKRFVRKQEPKRVPVDVNEVVESALRIIAGQAHERGVEVVFDGSGHRLQVMGDAIQIEQVMVNLLTNALDALDDVTHAKLLLIEANRTEKGQVEVRVIDNGCGLPTLDGVDVFEAFMTTKIDGLGMGLAISRSLIEAHGGQLTAETNECGGATFRFQLSCEDGGKHDD